MSRFCLHHVGSVPEYPGGKKNKNKNLNFIDLGKFSGPQFECACVHVHLDCDECDFLNLTDFSKKFSVILIELYF